MTDYLTQEDEFTLLQEDGFSIQLEIQTLDFPEIEIVFTLKTPIPLTLKIDDNSFIFNSTKENYTFKSSSDVILQADNSTITIKEGN